MKKILLISKVPKQTYRPVYAHLCIQIQAFFIANVQYTTSHNFFWKWLEPELCTPWSKRLYDPT